MNSFIDRGRRVVILNLAFATLLGVSARSQTLSELYAFPSASDPEGALALDSGRLYGFTSFAGSSGDGTVFSLNSDGTGYQLMHSFTGADGNQPLIGSTPLISSSTLYGVTYGGGSGGAGTVFKMNTSGTGYQVLHNFTGFSSDGDNPIGTLTLSGSTLYGVTEDGGAQNIGTIYKINTDGTALQFLHSFSGGSMDGNYASGGVLLSGTTLFGMTKFGGTTNMGTVYKMNIDGSGFQVLHSFTGADGKTPMYSLTLSGSTLYGMTASGGANGLGSVFKVGVDGSGFQLLHSFTGASDGYDPIGSLTLSGGTLYGVTLFGSGTNEGSVFAMNTDGTGYESLYTFTGGADGGYPWSTPTISGSTLYGMNTYGGASGHGVVFALSVPERKAGSW